MSNQTVKANLGEKIKFFRLRQCLSQMQLETQIGLGTGSISRIENNEIIPTQETRLKIARALKLDIKEVAYLMGINFYKDEKGIECAKDQNNV